MAFDAITQLEEILKRWTRDQRVEIQGIILDYIHRSGKNLYEVLTLNHAIYDEFFIRGDMNAQENLLRSVVRSNAERQELQKLCIGHFPVIAERLLRDSEILSFVAPKVSMETDEVMKFIGAVSDRKAVIWQLSDIHFGKFNVWLKDPEELAACLGLAVKMCQAVAPDYIIVSGDVSSTADQQEFNDFCKFCTALSRRIWGTSLPQRILVVPGNHDTAWMKDGTADCLTKFGKVVGESGVCITPFGPASMTYCNPNVKVSRFKDGAETPPYALVTLSDCDLTFLLLVTSYHSGFVPVDLRQLLTDELSDDLLRDRIINHVRTDAGQINMQYLDNLAKGLNEIRGQTVAVSHHHLVQYGALVNQNKYAYTLLKLLSNKGIDLVFHGHLHMFEDQEPVRPYIQGLSYCIPCTTLTSHPTLGTRGFMVHAFGKDGTLLSLTWEISADGAFNREKLRPAYLYKRTNTGTAVQHF